MTNNHLSDSAIQEFVLDEFNCSKVIRDHILICDGCRAKAANYKSLFGTLKTVQPSLFDFDLASVVVSQLPVRATTTSESNFIYLIIMVALVAMITPLLIFWRFMQTLFSSAMPIVLYISVTAALLFLIFQGIEMFRRYRQKMMELNIY